MNRPPRTPMEEALAYLREYFAAHPEGGWHAEIVEGARRRGVAKRTLSRAATRIGVQRADGGMAGSVWRPPADEDAA